MSGSGISWAICKSAPCSRQITMPAPHHSVFTGRMPFLLPNQQRQSTEGMTENNWNKYNVVFVFSDCRRKMMFTLTQVIHVYSALTQKHYAHSCQLSVCSSVCQSQVGVLLKRLNVGLHKNTLWCLGDTIRFYDTNDLNEIQTGSHWLEAEISDKCSTWVKIGGFKK